MKAVKYQKGGKLKVLNKKVSIDPPRVITGWKIGVGTS